MVRRVAVLDEQLADGKAHSGPDIGTDGPVGAQAAAQGADEVASDGGQDSVAHLLHRGLVSDLAGHEFGDDLDAGQLLVGIAA